MGLYLCVFASDDVDDELEGVEVGGYDDWHQFRSAVAQLEADVWGSQYPVLMGQRDSDARWELDQVGPLAEELRDVAGRLAEEPPQTYSVGSWQAGLARSLGLTPRTLADCFIDVDGEPLLQRVIGLCAVAENARAAIWLL